MRRILWCIISLCLILLSLALLLRFRDDADPLPAPLENVVSHVEGLLSLSPEHAVDEFKQDEEEEVQKEDGEEEDAKEADVYEANPRYTIEQDPEQGEVLRSEIQKGDTAGKILGDWMDANDLAELLAGGQAGICLDKARLSASPSPLSEIRRPRRSGVSSTKSIRKNTSSSRRRTTVSSPGLKRSTTRPRWRSSKERSRALLSGAVTEQGENVALAIALANVFASEINFISDLRGRRRLRGAGGKAFPP